MPYNKENTDPEALRATQDAKTNPSSYGRTPGAVGLRGWQPPQAHMFVSTPASATGYSTFTHLSHVDVFPASDPVHTRHTVSPIEARNPNRTSGSPLKVRKTRENLRKGFSEEAVPTSKYSVPDLVYNKPLTAQASQNARGTITGTPANPHVASTRFSWESDTTMHSTTIIEQPPSKRTSTESNKSDQQFAPSLSRKLSVRKRVVSRVKDSFLNRTKSSSKLPSRANPDVAISRTASEQERVSQITANKGFESLKEDHMVASHPSAFNSIQSFMSEKTCEGSLVPLLRVRVQDSPEFDKAFPRSDGSFSSPQQASDPSLSPSPEKTPRPARRSTPPSKARPTPKELAMLHIRLSVTPAWRTLDLADEATIWAMIKAEATVSADPNSREPICPRSIGKTQQPLDVVVIVDNSQLASPLALQSMSQFTQNLCNLLRDRRDRLAVFYTYCLHESQCPGTTAGCQIIRLQRPNVTLLMADLAKLEASKASDPSSVVDMSGMMQEVVKSVVERSEDPIGRETHAFVLSPLPLKCAAVLQELVSWPIHQVQVGCSYQAPASRDQVQVSGWRFEWEAVHGTILENLIQSAREGSRVGELSHVRVSINSTVPCRVEKLLIPPRKATLYPGQSTTLFAKVRIPSVEDQEIEGSASFGGLFNQLHKTLGSTRNELFKADVRYRHFSLPRDTQLRTEKVCEIMRTNRNSQWGAVREVEDQDGLEVEIEKAKFAARNYPPDVAIKILQKKFGNLWSGSDGPAVLQRLREELEFQKSISTDTSRIVAQSTTRTTHRQAPKEKRQVTMHLADAEALQVFNTAPSTPTPEEGNTKIATHSSEDRLDHERKKDSIVEQDEARRIWRHMRRNSRTTSGPLSSSEASSRAGSETRQHGQRRGSQESVIDRMAAADVRLKEIRQKAIQNKRSVGAETLRDFGMMQQQHQDEEQEELQHEACVPWL